MTENEHKNDNFSFIKEKIKDMPTERKRLLKPLLRNIAFGIVFGLVASFIFALSLPYFSKLLQPKEESTITFSEDGGTETQGTEESTENSDGNSTNSTQEDNSKSTTNTKDTEIQTSEKTPDLQQPSAEIDPMNSWDLSDFQQLQNKLYAVGKEADHFIVTVTGVKSDTDWYNNAYETKGQVSGILIGDLGEEILVLTETKVIVDAQSISVTFLDGKTVDASLKKHDGNTGLAVLSIDKNVIEPSTIANITYAPLGNSLSVDQGNLVIAVGSPLGTNYSISTGNITSITNTIDTTDMSYTVYTTDIVGSATSSGALLNLKGEIIGLVMEGSSSEADQSTITAISISELKQLIELLSNGKDVPYLGLSVRTVTDMISSDYGLPKGVYIKQVSLDSPALVAGLQSGDVIVSMDESKITTAEAYEAKVLSMSPGETMNIVVNRQGANGFNEINYTVTAGILP